jgi:translocation and assembly module TamB
MRILRNIGIGLAGLVLLLAIAGILVVRTDWFRNFVRGKIVTATEEATGGRVDIGSFSFDWTHLSAVVTDFVVHGNEPAGAPPYLSAKRVEVHIRLLTSIHHLLDIQSLSIDGPQANITVAADGSTNVPRPKPSAPSKTSPLQSVVDLAVGHFELTNGSLRYNSQIQNIDLRGDGLHVQLWYDALKQGYKGQVSLTPLYVVSGRNTPVKFFITLPLTLDANRIALQNASIQTDRSQLTIDGSLANLNDPTASGHIRGHVALDDLKNVADLQMPLDTRGMPQSVDLDVNATSGGGNIDVSDARVAYGDSTIHASGKLQDASGKGSLQFQVSLALAELGRLARLDMRPEGTFQANGSARIGGQNNYDVQAFVDTKGISFLAGARRIRDISLVAEAQLTPQRLNVTGLRLGAFGAEITGDASLEDFARYSAHLTLSHLNLETAMRDLGQKSLGYSGTVSGPIAATGDLKSPGTSSLTADAHLAIAPGRQGIPVAGRIFADYRGATDNLAVDNSYLTLPHTRLNLSGSVGNRLNITLDTSDLRDFNPLTGGNLPVVLDSQADIAAVVTGHLKSPQIAGHLAVGRFAAEGRQFDSFAGDIAASRSRVALTDASVRRGAMDTELTASVGLQDWSPGPNDPLAVRASVRNGDLADVMALAGVAPQGYAGALTAEVNIAGTVGNPRGAANLAVVNGTLDGQPIDRAQAQVNMTDQLIAVTNAQVASGPSHVDLSAEFHHPRDSFDRGAVHAHVQSNSIDLSTLRTVQNLRPNSGGTLQLTADVTGQLAGTFEPQNVTLDASGKGLRIDGQSYGDFTAAAHTSGQTVTYNVDSNFAGSQVRVNGNTSLAASHDTTADAHIANLPVDRVLALLKRTDIPVKGTLTATAQVSGTLANPTGTLDATIDRAAYQDQPIDRVHAHVSYLPTSVVVSQFEVRAGTSSLDATARYDHQAGVLNAGDAQFRITDGHLDLAKLQILQDARPGLAGTVQLTANGAATIANGGSQITPRDVNLDLAAKSIAVQSTNLGGLTLVATSSGSLVNFTLGSDFAGAQIQGKGSAQLTGDYPVNAQVTMHNVTYKGLQPLLGPASNSSTDIDGVADGEITVNGSFMKTDALAARVQLSRLELTATSPGFHNESVTIQNQGPVAVALDHGVARVESMHLTGPQTDFQVQGSASMTAQTIQATLNAHTDLGVIQKVDRDVVSSGQLSANATIRGTFSDPIVNGQAQLKNASFNLLDFTTGISNANGNIDFNGTSAQFQNLTGDVGGGKVTLSGFMAFTGASRLALRVSGRNVRIRIQPGVSVTADTDVHLSGRLDASVVSGSVIIGNITYAPKSDLGAILSRAAPAVQTSATPSPVLDNMKLDVTVRTSSATLVKAAVAQSLQMDANLHLVGTASQPGITGRIAISEGKLVFMSSTYTVNVGTINFYNPIRIAPVLDLSLQTAAQGVTITLRVTGPIDNMQLSYTSNPPLQFQEVVGLLAAGQTPTSDPNILANQPAQPQQSFQEMGESAVVGQALADPVANRLQRVFGISQIKIDPTFANGQDLPTAQFSVEQRITSRITLTYSTPSQAGGQEAVSGQYLISPQWSATATRDQFGLFSIKIMYKRQFK